MVRLDFASLHAQRIGTVQADLRCKLKSRFEVHLPHAGCYWCPVKGAFMYDNFKMMLIMCACMHVRMCVCVGLC